MFARKVFSLLAGVAIVGALATSPTHAMGDSHRTYFTFSGPVRLPGVVLPAGKYVFELPTQEWTLVRVSSFETNKTYLLAFTRIVDRPADRKLDATIVLGETSGHAAPPINVWYSQGERTGRQFIYYPTKCRHAGR